jgi:hypothetical protein
LNLHKNIVIAFTLLMGLLLSEVSLHSVFHADHHEEHHHEVCDGHHQEADSGADSICSHEHQCELCTLIQTNSNFLPKAKSPNFAQVFADGHFQRIENTVFLEPIEVSGPRAPPVV